MRRWMFCSRPTASIPANIELPPYDTNGSGMSDSHYHDPNDLPLLVVGRGVDLIRSGRHINVGNAPLGNVFLDLANKFGAEMDSFGDESTGELGI